MALGIDRTAERRAEEILTHDTLKQLDRMATLYEVHYTLKTYFEQRQPWARMAAVIGKDRVLALKAWEAGRAKALAHDRVLKGPTHGGSPDTGHVEAVLRLLGEDGVRKVVLQATEQEMAALMAGNSLGCPEYDRCFWCHGALSAYAMLRLLSVHSGIPEMKRRGQEAPSAGQVFRMGLLLDVGVLLLHVDDPEITRGVWAACTQTSRYLPYARGEAQILRRCFHAVKGARVMACAGWSDMEAQVTKYHHAPYASGGENPYLPVIQCAHLADAMASLLVLAPSLAFADLDVDAASFDAVFKGRDPGFIRDLVRVIVEDARGDGFNLAWSWPGYREMLNRMVASTAQRVEPEMTRKGIGCRPFSWWLNQNQGRVGEILIRHHLRKGEERATQ